MNERLRTEVSRLGPWYQSISFDKDFTNKSDHSRLSGEFAWKYIKPLLPPMDGLRVLDLGSNAGLFSIRCSQMGAEEVIGIEREDRHLRQARFVKDYFSKVDGVNYNVKFMKAALEDFPKMNLGKFDIVLAISVLYWIGRLDKPHYCKANRDREIQFIEYLSTQTDNVIVRCRDGEYNNSDYYQSIFGSLGFEAKSVVSENEDVSKHKIVVFSK